MRLGEISREKGATTATGSTGGFWTGLWSPDGNSVACLGRTGSWRRWEYDVSEDLWRPCIATSGHTKAVTGIAWSKDGEYLLSTSLDQTTRLHTKWTSSGANTWHEMSRPQIHGYDLNCIDSISAAQFVSGADEKLMRVFSEPRAVAAMPAQARRPSAASATCPPCPTRPTCRCSGSPTRPLTPSTMTPRSSPSTTATAKPWTWRRLSRSRSSTWTARRTRRSCRAPRSGQRPKSCTATATSLSCLAASHDGTLVASACKASSLNHAVIRIFETGALDGAPATAGRAHAHGPPACAFPRTTDIFSAWAATASGPCSNGQSTAARRRRRTSCCKPTPRATPA